VLCKRVMDHSSCASLKSSISLSTRYKVYGKEGWERNPQFMFARCSSALQLMAVSVVAKCLALWLNISSSL
jgi:hypothetical protein